MMEKEEIFSKVLKAGDYYLTITDSKQFTNDDGSFHYKKHKIYLYKEDFSEFNSILAEMTDYIFDEKGEEVISERHQKDFKKEDYNGSEESNEDVPTSPESFTDVCFN